MPVKWYSLPTYIVTHLTIYKFNKAAANRLIRQDLQRAVPGSTAGRCPNVRTSAIYRIDGGLVLIRAARCVPAKALTDQSRAAFAFAATKTHVGEYTASKLRSRAE